MTQYLFKDEKAKIPITKKRISDIAKSLADINEFPINLPRFESEDGIIGTGLRSLICDYTEKIEKIGCSKFLEYLKIEEPKLFPYANRDSENRIRQIVNYVIIAEVDLEFPSVDKYIGINPSDERVFKELSSLELDKYNLVTIDDRFKLENHGVIFDGKHLIYYHPFLRRFYNSNFVKTPIFLREAAKKNNLELKIAIDPLRITLPENLKNIFERDHWWGPKFSRANLNKASFEGLSIYKRLKNELLEPWPLERTEFFISNRKDGLKEIQIEEIVPHSNNKHSDLFYLQKYAHLLWDKDKDAFIHFDVAIKVYNYNEHRKRICQEWKSKNPNDEALVSEKIKLFRLDGKIDIESTMNLLGDFFRYNELISEFFDGK